MGFIKRVASIVISVLIVTMSLSGTLTLSASANVSLTDEQISAKNYPVPEHYKVKDVYGTYDTEDERGAYKDSFASFGQSTEEGTYYDTASLKISTTNANREVGVTSTNIALSGDGFMFWYKSDTSVEYRLRLSNSNIMIYGTLAACPEGRWVTYYYYGASTNISVNSSSSHKDLRPYVNDENYTFKFSLYFGTAETRSVYFDEFYSFEAIKTNADVYNNDNEFLKFSFAKRTKLTNTIDNYDGEGSATLTSTYGSTLSKNLVNIDYTVDSNAVENAIAKAKSGSNYLKVSVTTNNCVDTNDLDSYAKFALSLTGTEATVVKYLYGKGNTETFLINVSNVEASAITGVNVTITSPSSVKDVSFTLSPITVYYENNDYSILQAEDLNGVYSSSRKGEQTPVATITDTGENRTYINVSSKTGYQSYTEFTLPELEVGEYTLGAECYMTTSGGTFSVTTNNINIVNDVNIGDDTFVSYARDYYQEICNIKITKNYSDGATKLRFTTVPKKNQRMCIDYFTLKKTDTVVQSEPNSNFVIKDYPEMENYEVKTVLDNFDDYICSSDDRYYLANQVYGYVGDGNAFNLNSRGTAKSNFDNNGIYSGTFDGDGIRFWYKSPSSAEFQFKNSSGQIVYKKTLSSNTGDWVTLYYTDLSEDGDMSQIKSMCMKTASGGSYYIDELHTIIEKIGDVIYELNGDGTASVTGYNLRLEDITIDSTYKGCPVTTIKSEALSSSKTLKNVVLPDSITTIESGAFSNDLNLQSVTFGKSLTSIGDNCFAGCSKLGDVNMPNSITSISANAFDECSSLTMNVEYNSYSKSFAIENSIKYRSKLSSYTYLNSNGQVSIEKYDGIEEDVEIPSLIDDASITTIESGVFKDNTSLKSVVVPNSTITIGSEVFSGCSSLASVTLGNNVTEIGDSVFYNNTSLSKINLPNSLLTIGENSFYNCANLLKLTIPASLTSIADNSFDKCDSIVVDVVRDSYAYTFANTHSIIQIPDTTSDFKYELENYQASIISYIGNDTSIIIPDTIDGYDVVAVGKNAFKDNKSITYVKFGVNCKTIYEYAFSGCSALENFDINDVRSIKAYGFNDCVSLGNVTITNVVSYSDFAFSGCTNLVLNVVKTQFGRTAMELCNSWHVGINLGNCFCSYNKNYGYGSLTPIESEKLWGAPETTKPMIDFLAEGGFDVLRMAVTWRAFIDDENDYTVDEAYLARVKQVIDWAIADDMYVVLNVHHDTVDWLNLANYSDETSYKFQRLWEQIADYFKDYDEHLIFESLNEARYNEDWDGNTQTGLFTEFNELQKLFYNTVRNSGGFNDVRYLMLETYGAQAKVNHLRSVWCPTLEEDNHIMMSVHYYTNNIGEGNWNYNLGLCKQYFTDIGIPCVLGETGMQNYAPMYDYEHARWADAVMSVAEKNGLKILFWDDNGGFAMFKRVALEWNWPAEIKTIMNHAYRKEDADDLTPSVSISVSKTEHNVKAQMVFGGSMRYPTTSSSVDGIRFLAKYKTSDIQEILDLGYEITDYGTNFTYQGSEKVISCHASDYYRQDDKYSTVAGSIVNIAPDHITGEFTGEGYLTFSNGTEEITLTSTANDNSRSIAYIASRVKSSGEYASLSDNAKKKVDEYALKYNG